MEKQALNRRSFLGTVSKLTAAGAVALLPVSEAMSNGFAEAVEPSAMGEGFLTKPYINTCDNTCMNIRWITQKPCFSWVEYGEGDKLDKKAVVIDDGLIEAYNRINEIVITGLEPGKRYQYRVVSKEITEFQPYKLVYGATYHSEVYSFKTPENNANAINWLVLNDIHDRPQSFKDLMALNGETPFDYVFLNGDMFDYQTDEKQLIDHLIAPCTDCFATSKPMAFVRGNHETRGKFARNLKDYFSYPKGQYFTMHWGPVFMIALDTGEDKADDHAVYAGIVDFDGYREKQAQWLEKVMHSKAYRKAKYKVVQMHIPPYYSGDGHGTLHCRKLFSPLFNKYKVDLVISGHTHKYGVHKPVKNEHDYGIVIGGGPQKGTRTLIKVQANENKLALQMIKDNGEQVGEYFIDG